MTQDMKSAVKPWWIDLGVMFCVTLATGFCSLALPGTGMAATIVVNSLDDTVSNNGVCTLREAVLNAEHDNHSGSTDCAAGHGADTITFSLSGTINALSSSDLTMTSAGGLIIDGGGKITISGFGSGISVGPAGVLTLKNFTFANSSGISNAGTMTLDNCTVSNNFGLDPSSPFFESEQDGAIYNATGGTLTISHSTVRDNTAALPAFDHHGGIIDNHGTMTISTSTINGNQGFCRCGREDHFGGGGAIHNGPEGILTINNSTVSDTLDPITVTLTGIYNEGVLTLSHSTVSNNATGSIFNSGTLKLHTSLLADGCAAANLFGPPGIPITSLGYNLDKIGTCGLTGPGDKSNIDPRLDPAGLKDNGGPTKTLALCTGSGTPAGCTGKSPAIDAIPTANCTGAGGNPLGTDQRGFFRPADGDRNGTALCDIGAVEANSAQLQTLNSLVTFTPLPATYQTSRDTTGCPAGSVGKFRFTADLANKPGSPPLSHVVAEVATLTKGNLVLNADGGLGGDGATVTFSPSGQYADGVLTAKEHVGLPVTLCLKTFSPFTFFVNVLGTR